MIIDNNWKNINIRNKHVYVEITTKQLPLTEDQKC